MFVKASVSARRMGIGHQLRDARRLIWFAGIACALAVGLSFLPDRSLARSMFLGGLFGMAVQWWNTCSAVIEIPSDRLTASNIEQWLKTKGYRDGPAPGVLKFKHPEWMCFDSQTITLQKYDAMTRVTGPYFILRALSRVPDTKQALTA